MTRRAGIGAKAQRGVALIAMLAIFAMGATYFLLRALNSQASVTAAERARNAEVLNLAKQALIGYAARQAALPAEDNPGRLPCPEAAGFVGTANEGIAAGNCTLPAVGRLPWRTLGLDKLRDADGEPLWYAVSAGWALPSAGAFLTINSNTLGQLTLDGQANAAIALIIAPGAPMNVQAAAGCAARVQVRTAVPPDLRDYLECDNATFGPPDAVFATSGPLASFNDQVLAVTTQAYLPALEAAISHRIDREIAPVMRTVYQGAQWSLGASPMYPFAVPFSDPGPGAGSSSYQGEYNPLNPLACPNVPSRCQGLLPFTFAGACGADPRCSSTFVAWLAVPLPNVVQTGGAGAAVPNPCIFTAADTIECTGAYVGTVNLRMTATAQNVAMALRQLDATQITLERRFFFFGWFPWMASGAAAASAAFNSNGSARVFGDATFSTFFGLNFEYRITARIGVLANHALLDSTNPTTGWFVRNEWYRLAYYAPALNHTAHFMNAGLLSPQCASGATCLNVANVTSAAGTQRAILIVGGRSLAAPPPAPRTLADFVEYGNADGDTSFEQQPVSIVIPPNAATKTPFNDRVVVVDAN